MRRAVIQNLRPAFRRPNPRKSLKQFRSNSALQNAGLQRTLVTRPSHTLQSSPMRWGRRIATPVALGVGAAASYYAYQQRTAHSAHAGGHNSLIRQGAGIVADAPPAYSVAVPGGLQDQSSSELPEAVRKALIVDQGQLYTTEIPADLPISKETDYSGRKVLEMLTPEQTTAKLRTNEESYLVGRGEGVVRYDVVQIPSNDPIEDDHVEKIVEIPNTIAATDEGKTQSDWMFWGVFDGHAGWTTSAKLRQTLVSYVARELNATYKSALQDPKVNFPTADAVDAAIKSGFLKLDQEITHESVQRVLKSRSKVMAAEILAPALSGSCALLSFYDSRSKELRVACTGDSRAVLGRRGDNGKWAATPLSVDQTGGTPSEEARLRKEHPNEPHVVLNGRILGGLEPSRAFGDAVYKWSKDTQEKMKNSFFGRSPSRHLQSPPYVTAEPVITTTKVDPSRGDFVVMATDGLWEMLTNEEVVGLVGQWLDHQSTLNPSKSSNTTQGWISSWFGSGKSSSLPVEHDSTEKDGKGQRAPIRQQQWNIPSGKDARFVVEDKNVATHLVRNALGGKDQDTLSALLTLPSPFSRRYRDDLTVQVIFFGEVEEKLKSGKVELNVDASATASANKEGAKAKL